MYWEASPETNCRSVSFDALLITAGEPFKGGSQKIKKTKTW